MTYATAEQSRHAGAPVELYLFEMGGFLAAGSGLVVSDGLEYPARGAAETAGWVFTGGTHTVGATDATHGGTYSVRMNVQDGTCQMTRTFTAADGIAANTSYLVQVWGRQSSHAWYDTNSRLEVTQAGLVGGMVGANLVLVGAFEQIGVTAISTAAATLTCKMLRRINFEEASPVWWDDFTITALEDPAPVPGATIAYTSDGVEHTFNGVDYSPAILTRSALESGNGESSGGELDVTMPRDHAVAQFFHAGTPVAPLTLTLYRVHRDDIAGGTSYLTPFRGSAARARFHGGACTVTFASLRSLLDRKRPHKLTQAKCSHMLYDHLCQLAKDTYRTDTTVAALSGRALTLTGLATASGTDTTRYAHGFVVLASGERVFVEAQNGDVLTLLAAPTSTVVVGEPVSAHWGCDRTTGSTGCGRFSNILRFGGEPGMPQRNMFGAAGLET